MSHGDYFAKMVRDRNKRIAELEAEVAKLRDLACAHATSAPDVPCDIVCGLEQEIKEAHEVLDDVGVARCEQEPHPEAGVAWSLMGRVMELRKLVPNGPVVGASVNYRDEQEDD